MGSSSWVRFGAVHRILQRLRLGLRVTAAGTGAVALVIGLLTPWRRISYFGSGQISDGVLLLPGGLIYSMLVAAVTVVVLCGGARRPRVRVGLAGIGLALAGYSGFWLVGALMVASDIGFSLAEPTAGLGLLCSFAGSLLLVSTPATARRRSSAAADSAFDLLLPVAPASGAGALASTEGFLRAVEAASDDAGWDGVPVLVLRADGLDEIRRRYGSAAADRISVAMIHRLRGHLRAEDAVVCLLPGEAFALLSGVTSEVTALVVAQRLQAVLCEPPLPVERRYLKRLKPIIRLARCRLTDGRLRITLRTEILVDAPVHAAGDTASLIDLTS